MVVLSRERHFDVVAIHNDFVTLEKVVKLVIAHIMVANFNAHQAFDMWDVLFTDERLIRFEAFTVSKWMLEISMLGHLLLSLEVLNNEWLARAHLKSLVFDTLTQEELDAKLLTKVQLRVHV